MDLTPFQDVYGNLLASALWQWATSLWSDRDRSLVSADPHGVLDGGPVLRKAVTEAARELADVETIDPALGGERLRDFLVSREITALLSDLFTLQASEDSRVRARVRHSLVVSWERHTGVPARDLEPHG